MNFHSEIEVIFSSMDNMGEISSIHTVGGGSINDAYQLKTNKGNYFLKVNDANAYPNMFEREQGGLQLLSQPKVIRVPEVIQTGVIGKSSFLLMEFIEEGRKGADFWETFANQLADLHRNSNDYFGLDQNNYMGSLPQDNSQSKSWGEFFVTRRIEPTVKMSRDLNRLSEEMVRKFDRFYATLEDFFPKEKPSLIHGDLWSGNYMADKEGNPVIYDPAVYYGHREMDIAMTQLFGGCSAEFYEHYNEVFPMEKGWEERMDVANLYPLLVHVVLFGGGYARQVESILRRFI